MFEFLNPDNNAIGILKTDHTTVKDLFDRFEQAASPQEKKRIADETIRELKIHAEIEEKIFYPAVRKGVGKEIMMEADEEHHVAKLLVAELETMDGTEEHFDAKYKVLAENIRHHIREEESEMMPKAREADLDFDALGERLLAKKEELKRNGIPDSLEAEMIQAYRGQADSPARTAEGKNSQPAKKGKLMNMTKRTSRKKTKTARKNNKKSKVISFAKAATKKVSKTAKPMARKARKSVASGVKKLSASSKRTEARKSASMRGKKATVTRRRAGGR